jgi:hypothetical protein
MTLTEYVTLEVGVLKLNAVIAGMTPYVSVALLTASWADKSLVDSKLFYPKEAKTAEAQASSLRGQFPPGRSRQFLLRLARSSSGLLVKQLLAQSLVDALPRLLAACVLSAFSGGSVCAVPSLSPGSITMGYANR